LLIDNAAHQLVIAPEQFDVIVTTNMNGDILSDLASGLVGGLGVAPSANIGYDVQMFEAVHGTAPDIAGANVVNPTAMILSAVMMLRQMGLAEHARALDSALVQTLAEGIHTADLRPASPVGTREFAEAIGERIQPVAQDSSAASGGVELPVIHAVDAQRYPEKRTPVGVDIFIETDQPPAQLGATLVELVDGLDVELIMVSNRGTQVWPAGVVEPSCVDHFRCRFELTSAEANLDAEVVRVIERIGAHYRWMHLEKLELHDGDPAFSKAQGQN